MKVEHDFDVDFNDYFTNSSSRDVSFGLGFNNKTAPQRGGQQPVAPATAAAIRQQIARNSAPAALQLQQQQQVGRRLSRQNAWLPRWFETRFC